MQKSVLSCKMSAIIRRVLPLKVLADASPKLKKVIIKTGTHRTGNCYFRDCSEPD